jgi:uncharacterized protein YkwD
MADIVSRSLQFIEARRPRATAILALVATATFTASASGAPAKGHALPQPCPGARTQITQASPSQMRSAVLCLVNRQRTSNQLPPLVESPRLDLSAQGWTDSMVRFDDFSHGTAFTNRISAVGFDWTTVGENIAAGFLTPAAVVSAWMNSPGHCANILDPAYREIGTGVSPGRVPQASPRAGTWTQDFGRLMNQPALSGNYGPADAC